MSQLLINEYRAELDRLRQITGSTRETNLRPAFARLLRAWGRQALDLVYVEEHQIRTGMGTLISVDGALLHSLRVPFGYWEAKDAKDDLDREIADKLRKGYPRDNIIFSDDVTAVLYQDGGEVARAAMQTDEGGLLALLERFFAHERQEIAEFNQAMKQFAIDLPAILGALRDRIAEKHAQSRDFAAAVQALVKHAQDAINPSVGEDEVREMLIQHILTEDIFAKVFDNPDYHRHNNVAAELKKLEDKLFGYGEKAQLLRGLARYYNGIQQTAALIESHSEKQGFLKALYEDFYKAYNRKAADRLGVVYTPGEIVRFMIRSADFPQFSTFRQHGEQLTLFYRCSNLSQPEKGTHVAKTMVTARAPITKHAIVEGDARDLAFLEKSSVHLVCTSPPYADLIEYPEHSGQLGNMASYEAFLDELDKVWTECIRVLVPGGRVACVVGDVCVSRRQAGRHYVLPLSADIQVRVRRLGFDVLTPIRWQKVANIKLEASRSSRFLGKPNLPNGIVKNDLEHILFFRKPGYRKPTTEMESLSRIETDEYSQLFAPVWTKVAGQLRRDHPAPYPVEIPRRLIRMFSFATDTVLDPFGGTGSTALAAMETGRNSVSVEIEPSYVDLLERRLTSGTLVGNVEKFRANDAIPASILKIG